METVLGLSLTPSTVGLVLVEGRDTNGATLERGIFDIRHGASVVKNSERVAAEVLELQARATAAGRRVHSVGVTWSDEAATEASLLVESLTTARLDNVVPIRFRDATEAFARGIGSTTGYEKTAVCVVELETTIVTMVDTRANTMHTVAKRGPGGDRLAEWLTAEFGRADWHPQALVVVGSSTSLQAVAWQLKEALRLPVFIPADARLALARGAAVAPFQVIEFTDAPAAHAGRHTVPARSWRPSYAGAMGMLVAGGLTFVVSLLTAVVLHLAPERPAAPVTHQQVAGTSAKPPLVTAPPPTPVAVITGPVVDAPPPAEAPISEPQDGVPDEPPADAPADPPVSAGEQQAADPPPPPGNPVLTRVLEHIPGLPRDPLPGN